MLKIDINQDFEQDIKRTKTRAKVGCLGFFIAIFALFFALILYFIGTFLYEMNFKENTIMVSESPKKVNTINVVEKGVPFFFGPSSVRLKYKDVRLDTSLYNDGKNLDESNVDINWKNDKEAMITLYGEEQVPEVIRFKLTGDDSPLFEIQHMELGYIPTHSQQDPLGDYAIQIRKSTNSKGSEQRFNYHAPVRVYYGLKGSEPTQFEEWHINGFSNTDHFKLYWNDEYVLIDVLGENDNGTTFVKDSLKVVFN